MKIQELQELFEKEETKEIAFEGKCHDCKKETVVVISVVEEEDKTYRIKVSGGAVYKIKVDEEYKGINKYYIKCDYCYVKKLVLDNFQNCEVYSRVVGYLRPISQWNPGKLQEFNDRKEFVIAAEDI